MPDLPGTPRKSVNSKPMSKVLVEGEDPKTPKKINKDKSYGDEGLFSSITTVLGKASNPIFRPETPGFKRKPKTLLLCTPDQKKIFNSRSISPRKSGGAMDVDDVSPSRGRSTAVSGMGTTGLMKSMGARSKSPTKLDAMSVSPRKSGGPMDIDHTSPTRDRGRELTIKSVGKYAALTSEGGKVHFFPQRVILPQIASQPSSRTVVPETPSVASSSKRNEGTDFLPQSHAAGIASSTSIPLSTRLPRDTSAKAHKQTTHAVSGYVFRGGSRLEDAEIFEPDRPSRRRENTASPPGKRESKRAKTEGRKSDGKRHK